MKIGQLVVLVDDVDGVEAGREGCIMGVRDDMLTVGCQTSERLHLVLAHTSEAESAADWRGTS